jgi:hypothetical protein
MDIQYIYLIQTREFVNSKEPIYKVGKTKQSNYSRFLQYPNGSIQLFQCVCNNCDILEKHVIKIFKNKYENHKIAGREYFKGELRLMICDLFNIIENETSITPVLNGNIVQKCLFDETTSEVVRSIDTQEVNTLINTSNIQEEYVNKIYILDGKYSCLLCNFHTTFNGNIKQHLLTKKHKTKMCLSSNNELDRLKCVNCDKQYKSYSGVWKHIQTCKQIRK